MPGAGLLAYRHLPTGRLLSGRGGLLTFILHAAIWHAVGRVIDRLPMAVIVTALIGLVAGILAWRLLSLLVRSTRPRSTARRGASSRSAGRGYGGGVERW